MVQIDAWGCGYKIYRIIDSFHSKNLFSYTSNYFIEMKTYHFVKLTFLSQCLQFRCHNFSDSLLFEDCEMIFISQIITSGHSINIFMETNRVKVISLKNRKRS